MTRIDELLAELEGNRLMNELVQHIAEDRKMGVQDAHFRCECGAWSPVHAIEGSPREFDATCEKCGRMYRLAWRTDDPPPRFEPGLARLPFRSDNGAA